MGVMATAIRSVTATAMALALANIDGLANLASVGGDLTIEDNPLLSMT